MYCVNLVTGETTFRTVQPAAGRVDLVVMPERQPALRVGMELREGVWVAETHVPAGWLFYAFEIDGRLDWDRDESCLRTHQGTRCSLALIASAKRETLNSSL